MPNPHEPRADWRYQLGAAIVCGVIACIIVYFAVKKAEEVDFYNPVNWAKVKGQEGELRIITDKLRSTQYGRSTVEDFYTLLRGYTYLDAEGRVRNGEFVEFQGVGIRGASEAAKATSKELTRKRETLQVYYRKDSPEVSCARYLREPYPSPAVFYVGAALFGLIGVAFLKASVRNRRIDRISSSDVDNAPGHAR